jgi:prophage tail gpP-like protein
MQVEINGKIVSNFLEVRVTSSIEALSNSLVATYAVENATDIPFNVDDKIKIKIKTNGVIGEKSIFNGYIEELSVGDDDTVRITGREKTADVIDSFLDGLFIKPPITLVKLIGTVLIKLNLFPDVVVDDNNSLTINKPFGKGEISAAEIGQNAWDFINYYCKKRQVFATSGGDGNIALVRQNKNNIAGVLYRQRNGARNNILSSSVSYNRTNRFNKYIFFSQGNPTSDDADFNSIVEQRGEATDNEIRKSRVFIQNSDTTNKQTNLKEEAKWEANIRRYRDFSYNCSVQDWFADNNKRNIFYPNQLLRVFDDRRGVQGLLFLKECTWNFSNSGNTTDLSFTYPDAVSLQVNRDFVNSKTNKIEEFV